MIAKGAVGQGLELTCFRVVRRCGQVIAEGAVSKGLELTCLRVWRRWGHVIAEGAVGKGLGSRSFLHKLKTGVVMHDASYLCPFQLEGRQLDITRGITKLR